MAAPANATWMLRHLGVPIPLNLTNQQLKADHNVAGSPNPHPPKLIKSFEKESWYAPRLIQRRNALSQHLYERIWRWIIHLINDRLERFFGVPETTLKASPHLNILDIFGFEDFGGHNNSLEQYCINYTNELLAQLSSPPRP